jgi:hypothetical protein
MGHDVSNIGLSGLASIRIGGMKLDTLPIGEAAIAKQQWSSKQAEDTANKIEHILGRYPRPSVAYLESRIRECQETIKNVKQLRKDQQAMIEEYGLYIRQCENRDTEIAKLDPEDDKAKIRELKLKYPPYNVVEMVKQIDQCKDAQDRCDNVVDQENDSIADLSGTLALCKQRDEELRQFGVKVG